MALTDGLISYWKLDEASGTRNDSHGSNHLTDNNTVGVATGKIGNAADFESSSSEYLSHADNADLSTGDVDFTWQLWVNLESNGSSQYLLSKDNGSSADYALNYNQSADRFVFEVFGSSGYGNYGSVSADNLGAPSVGTWYLIHAWHDSVNDQLGIAVNAGAANTAGHSAGVLDSAAPFSLGALGAGTLPADGLIDEVGFWKRVLSSSERSELYNGGAGLAYPFGGAATAGPRPRRDRRLAAILEPAAEQAW